MPQGQACLVLRGVWCLGGTEAKSEGCEYSQCNSPTYKVLDKMLDMVS